LDCGQHGFASILPLLQAAVQFHIPFKIAVYDSWNIPNWLPDYLDSEVGQKWLGLGSAARGIAP
jgi:hypothetical protein